MRIMNPNVFEQDIVDVNYQIFISDKKKSAYQTFSESHQMRYFSSDFVHDSLMARDFRQIRFEEWLTGAKASKETWGVCAIAKL